MYHGFITMRAWRRKKTARTVDFGLWQMPLLPVSHSSCEEKEIILTHGASLQRAL
jgi:hypothetical protein